VLDWLQDETIGSLSDEDIATVPGRGRLPLPL
jgi:hypothetical protein